jgi:hypothetical protein
MRTKYESIIEAVACAMEDHSYNVIWYYDFDKQGRRVWPMAYKQCRYFIIGALKHYPNYLALLQKVRRDRWNLFNL